jgi:hypothetical protein
MIVFPLIHWKNATKAVPVLESGSLEAGHPKKD